MQTIVNNRAGIDVHKILDDSGIRLGGLISDINGKSGQGMVNALIDGKSADFLSASLTTPPLLKLYFGNHNFSRQLAVKRKSNKYFNVHKVGSS